MREASITELGYARAMILGLAHPVGVPLVQDAAAQAAAEAENLINKG